MKSSKLSSLLESEKVKAAKKLATSKAGIIANSVGA